MNARRLRSENEWVAGRDQNIVECSQDWMRRLQILWVQPFQRTRNFLHESLLH